MRRLIRVVGYNRGNNKKPSLGSNSKPSENVIEKNKVFIEQVKGYAKKLNLHQKVGDIQEEEVEDYISGQSKEAVASRIVESSTYGISDRQV